MDVTVTDDKHGSDERARLRRNQLVQGTTSVAVDILNQFDMYVDILHGANPR